MGYYRLFILQTIFLRWLCLFPLLSLLSSVSSPQSPLISLLSSVSSPQSSHLSLLSSVSPPQSPLLSLLSSSSPQSPLLSSHDTQTSVMLPLLNVSFEADFAPFPFKLGRITKFCMLSFLFELRVFSFSQGEKPCGMRRRGWKRERE